MRDANTSSALSGFKLDLALGDRGGGHTAARQVFMVLRFVFGPSELAEKTLLSPGSPDTLRRCPL